MIRLRDAQITADNLIANVRQIVKWANALEIDVAQLEVSGLVKEVGKLQDLVARHAGDIAGIKTQTAAVRERLDIIESSLPGMASGMAAARTDIQNISAALGEIGVKLASLESCFNAHDSDSARHITAAERAAWNGKQDKLSAGSNIQISGNTISAAQPAGADLSSQQAVAGQAARNGSLNTFARSDHYHAQPAVSTVPSAGGTVAALTNSASGNAGTAATWSRSDHRHGLPTQIGTWDAVSVSLYSGFTLYNTSMRVNSALRICMLNINFSSGATTIAGGTNLLTFPSAYNPMGLAYTLVYCTIPPPATVAERTQVFYVADGGLKSIQSMLMNTRTQGQITWSY